MNGGSTPYRLLVNDINNLNNSGFNPKDPTKILIHGFGGNGQDGHVIAGKNGRHETNVGHVCNPTAYNIYPYLQRYNTCSGLPESRKDNSDGYHFVDAHYTKII